MWYEKNSFTEPLQKKLRRSSCFIIRAAIVNHDLLHRRLQPPAMPDHKTLLEIKELAPGGLALVMNTIEHPIIEHFEEQLRILTLNPEVARRMMETRQYHIQIGA